MATISVYTFEDADGNEDLFNTDDAEAAKAYAMQNNLRVIDNEYEWSYSTPVTEWDFTA